MRVLACLLFVCGTLFADEPKDYSDQDLTGRNFSNKNLEKANFENAILKDANLDGAHLAGANLQGADLDHATLRGTDLSGADLRNTKLEYPFMVNVDLTGANLEGVDLSHVSLMRVKLRNANLRNLKAIGSCEACDFRGADLRKANLMGFEEGSGVTAKWRGALYDKTTKWPKGFDPEEAEVILVKGDEAPKPAELPPMAKEKDFRDQDLSSRKFDGTNLEGASFWNSDLLEAQFLKVHAAGADFSGTDLSAAKFESCDLTGADFRRSKSRWPSFTDCTLSKTNFEGVDISQFHLRRVKLDGANLRNAKIGPIAACDFSGADLKGADLSKMWDEGKSVWTGAIYDKFTTWPAGFDAAGAGAVKQ